MIYNSLPEDLKKDVHFKPSSILTKEMIGSNDSAALIPVMDLIKNKDLFISRSFGISFESSLNLSYIYFGSLASEAEKKFNEINLLGDVSSTEIILSKILFEELYDSSVSINLLTEEKNIEEKNLIITGDKNFAYERLFSGISFSEEIIEMLSFPFVTFALASKDESVVKKMSGRFNGIGSIIYDMVEKGKLPEQYSENVKEYIHQNISSLIIDLDSNDCDGIDQLLQLPYLHGMIENIIDLKFV
ncbi:MAG TPA: hypothetical protein VMT35_12460 [Ignavibacteriaceae bacterium]|nr:hypothetical protein [Ignavibacteriaceae bacterium]